MSSAFRQRRSEYVRVFPSWRFFPPRLPSKDVAGISESFAMAGGGQFDMKMFRGLPGFITKEDAQKHNAAVDRVFGRYGEYLYEWPSRTKALHLRTRRRHV
jgi:hypothetical protein